MHHVDFLHRIHTLDQLRKDTQSLLFWKSFASGNVLTEIAALTMFKENVEIGFGFFHIDKVYDVFIFAVVQKSYLALEYLQVIVWD